MKITLIVGVIIIIAGLFVLGSVINGDRLFTGKVISNPSSSSSTDTINIVNFVFSPNDVVVSVGTTVTWTNKDSVSHTVTSDDGEFDSDMLEKGDTYSHTFDKAGVYEYHCKPHPFMRGKVIVNE